MCVSHALASCSTALASTLFALALPKAGTLQIAHAVHAHTVCTLPKAGFCQSHSCHPVNCTCCACPYPLLSTNDWVLPFTTIGTLPIAHSLALHSRTRCTLPKAGVCHSPLLAPLLTHTCSTCPHMHAQIHMHFTHLQYTSTHAVHALSM